MKARTASLLILFMLQVLPMLANDFDYLNVYMKDGTTDRHLLALVQKIGVTKCDANGELQSEYCTQQIVMKDSTVYTYALTDVDSIVYRKVEEEQIAQSLESVLPTVEELFEESESPEEMAERLVQLQPLEGVEDVYVGTSSVTVQIKDWRRVTYYFTPELPFVDRQMAASDRRHKMRNTHLLEDYAPKVNNDVKVVIANQMHNNMSDYRQMQTNALMYPLYQEFLSLGFDAVYDDNPDVEFYANRMFDNDIILLDTHGSYFRDIHWVLSSDEIDITPDDSITIQQKFRELYQELSYDYNMMEFGCTSEFRDGKDVAVFYYNVSEKFIEKQNHSFHNAIPPIFFNVACESMKGQNDLQQYSSGIWVKGNAGMADVLQQKGIDTYWGYNESDFFGQYAGADILHAMLLGCSEEKAVSLLDPLERFEDKNFNDSLFNAYLLDRVSPYTSRGQFVVKTFTTLTGDEQASADYAASGQVNIIGITTKLRNTLVDASLVAEPTIVAGFRYGTDESLSTCKYIDNLEFVPVENDLGNYAFTYAIPVTPGQTVYYQAYTYDGMHYNYGEVRSFTVQESKEDTCEYVDLGLPSGTLWATCNIGADSPEEFGDYFAWGETTPKENFSWDNYKFCKGGSSRRLTKYCSNVQSGENGFTDGKIVLDPEDDAAYIKYGEGYRMPTANEWTELFNNCTVQYELKNGVKGIWLTSKINTNRIYLPFTREYGNGSNYGSEYVGNYWSASTDASSSAYYAGINYSSGGIYGNIRCVGKSIRPILSDVDISLDTETLDFGEVEVYDTGTKNMAIYNNGSRPLTIIVSVLDNSMFKTEENTQITIAAGCSAEIPVSFTPLRELDYKTTISILSSAYTTIKTVIVNGKGANSNVPAEAVDLGLSVKWASYNVGAHKPEEYGNHYAWGETDIKEEYGWDTYKYCEGKKNTLTKYNDYSPNGVVDKKVILEPEDDAAYQKWHGNWRTPTKEEWNELINNCNCTLTKMNGVTGYLMTSKVNGYTDKRIFLPCAGYYYYSNSSGYIHEDGKEALEYWSATSNGTKAFAVYENSGRLAVGSSSVRCNGYTVRPVSD